MPTCEVRVIYELGYYQGKIYTVNSIVLQSLLLPKLVQLPIISRLTQARACVYVWMNLKMHLILGSSGQLLAPDQASCILLL